MNDFIPYGKQWVSDEDIRAVNEVLRSDFLTQGPKVKEFEETICSLTGAKYCVAVANGTAALHLAALSLELPKGSVGITSPITFAASSNCLIYSNLTPEFCDIDLQTYNIDPEQIEKSIHSHVKLAIPVHFAGRAVDMQRVAEITAKHGIHVIEDAAHAIGSRYKDGSPVGNCRHSDMTIFSFHPVKTVTTGEGGAVTTNNVELYEKLVLLRSHGITKSADLLKQNPGPWYYEMQELGFNYRLCDLQAALGISQLSKLEEFRSRRLEIFYRYNSAFDGTDWITCPSETGADSTCFHLYVSRIDFEKLGKCRAEVMERLRQQRIGTQVHYIPVYKQPYYREHYGYEDEKYPNAERYYQGALSLPLYPKLTDDEQAYVIENILSLGS